MHKEFLMGNEAIALGALAAGVNLVAGYPGTPSTEVIETIAKRYTEKESTEGLGYHEAGGAKRRIGPLDEPGIHRREGRHGRHGRG